ncbi:MAG: hypothetical protein WB791_02335 [Waddliaceae bacterium]
MAAPVQNPPPVPQFEAVEPMTKEEALSVLDVKAQEIARKLFDELNIPAIKEQKPIQYLFGKLMGLQQEQGGATAAVKAVFPHLFPKAEREVLATEEGRAYQEGFDQALNNGFKIMLSSFVYPAAKEVVEDNRGVSEALRA